MRIPQGWKEFSAKNLARLFMGWGVLKGLLLSYWLRSSELAGLLAGAYPGEDSPISMKFILSIAVVSSLPWLVAGIWLYLWSRNKPPYWWPLQSPVEREILEHCSPEERGVVRKSEPFPTVCAVLAVVVSLEIGLTRLSIHSGTLLALIPLFLGGMYFQRVRRRRLCATAYALEQGITRADLRRGGREI